jgi:hypothetical protein
MVSRCSRTTWCRTVYQISYSHHGKSTTEFVKREKVAEVRQQLATYARFRKLVDEWVTLSLRLAKLRR